MIPYGLMHLQFMVRPQIPILQDNGSIWIGLGISMHPLLESQMMQTMVGFGLMIMVGFILRAKDPTIIGFTSMGKDGNGPIRRYILISGLMKKVHGSVGSGGWFERDKDEEPVYWGSLE